MSENTAPSALKRKAQVGHEQFQARAMTAARALRVSMAKAAEAEFELALAVIGLTEAKGPAKPILDGLDETSLLLLLDTPGRGPGAALIDSEFVEALVQQQTMGRVAAVRPDAQPRRPTRTDAALVGPFLDVLFERAGPLPDTTSHMRLLSDVRFGAEIASTRLLNMALEAQEYVHFALTIDVDGGTRQGKMSLLLPPVGVTGDSAEPDKQSDAPDTPVTLEPVVMGLQAQLRVALCRLRMPFSSLAKLQPGDEIALPDGVMNKAEILTIAGRKVAQGKLGQIHGIRAIRMDQQQAGGTKPARRATDKPAGIPKMEPVFGDPDATERAADAAFAIAEKGPDMLGDLPMLPGDFESDLPDLGGMGADIGDLPELADIPGAMDMESGLPDLPSLPDIPGMDGLDLPDLPDLPDLKQA